VARKNVPSNRPEELGKGDNTSKKEAKRSFKFEPRFLNILVTLR